MIYIDFVYTRHKFLTLNQYSFGKHVCQSEVQAAAKEKKEQWQRKLNG